MANKDYNKEDGVWRTIGGRRVFIKNGQSLADAMKESGKFKSAKKEETKKEDNVEKSEAEKEKEKGEKLNKTMDMRAEIMDKLDEETKDLSDYDKYNLAISKLENSEGMRPTEKQYWVGTKERFEKTMKDIESKSQEDPYDDPESEESQRLQSIQSRYDEYLQATEGRGASYGELAHIEGLRGKELDDFEKELDDFESNGGAEETGLDEYDREKLEGLIGNGIPQDAYDEFVDITGEEPQAIRDALETINDHLTGYEELNDFEDEYGAISDYDRLDNLYEDLNTYLDDKIDEGEIDDDFKNEVLNYFGEAEEQANRDMDEEIQAYLDKASGKDKAEEVTAEDESKNWTKEDYINRNKALDEAIKEAQSKYDEDFTKARSLGDDKLEESARNDRDGKLKALNELKKRNQEAFKQYTAKQNASAGEQMRQFAEENNVKTFADEIKGQEEKYDLNKKLSPEDISAIAIATNTTNDQYGYAFNKMLDELKRNGQEVKSFDVGNVGSNKASLEFEDGSKIDFYDLKEGKASIFTKDTDDFEKYQKALNSYRANSKEDVSYDFNNGGWINNNENTSIKGLNNSKYDAKYGNKESAPNYDNLDNYEVYERAEKLANETKDYELRSEINKRLDRIDRANRRGEGYGQKPTNELRDILKNNEGSKESGNKGYQLPSKEDIAKEYSNYSNDLGKKVSKDKFAGEYAKNLYDNGKIGLNDFEQVQKDIKDSLKETKPTTGAEAMNQAIRSKANKTSKTQKVTSGEGNGNFDMRKYEVEVQHDNGKSKVNVTASSEDQARKMVMNSEGAPESAILGVKDNGSVLNNKSINDAIREKAGKKKETKSALPKYAPITEQGNSNRKQVSENIQAHILDFYDSPEDFIEQVEVFNNMPTKWHAGQEMAKQGFYDIYYDDQRKFLDDLKINPKGKKFSDDKVFDMYASLIGRETEKLYNRLKKNQKK